MTLVLGTKKKNTPTRIRSIEFVLALVLYSRRFYFFLSFQEVQTLLITNFNELEKSLSNILNGTVYEKIRKIVDRPRENVYDGR